jgi:hypothetical protein
VKPVPRNGEREGVKPVPRNREREGGETGSQDPKNIMYCRNNALL